MTMKGMKHVSTVLGGEWCVGTSGMRRGSATREEDECLLVALIYLCERNAGVARMLMD